MRIQVIKAFYQFQIFGKLCSEKSTISYSQLCYDFEDKRAAVFQTLLAVYEETKKQFPLR